LVYRDSGAMLGEMCHINAASSGGPRYDPAKVDSGQSESDNLIILCPTHHSLVDQDQTTYTAEVLRQMKVQHETRVAAIIDNDSLSIGNQQAVDFARQVAAESVDFAIIVALRKEFDALKRHFPELTRVPTPSGYSRTYYKGRIGTALGGSYRLVATPLPLIGNLEAAHVTADLIRDWSPRFVLVCGIAGGLSRVDQDFGDVVVSESIVYYEPGKVRSGGVERRSRQFPSDRTLLSGISNVTGSEWRRRLPQRPDGKEPADFLPQIHVGPIASGEKVISAVEEVDRLRAGQANLIAVEMESAGVASAAFSALKKVGFLTVRAICDFADATKDNSWHEYAAGAAASYLRAFLETRPVAPSEGEWPSRMSASETAPFGDSLKRRKKLFDHLCGALDHEEFKNFCFLIGVNIDELPGDRQSSQVRELILLFERRKQISMLESAVEELGHN
ncbi:MAG: phosphorylase family protein, partial [Anaerolineaceae bacterium]